VVAAQQAVVDRLHHGSRPEEIAQSRANVASPSGSSQCLAAMDAARALTTLTTGRAVSEQDLEAAKAALDSAQAHLAVADQALELAVIGPRKEDIAQGEAQLRADQAQLELLHRQLADAELVARVMPSCATGSWSPAKWFLRKGRYWISRLPIRSGFAPTFRARSRQDSPRDESVDQHGRLSRPPVLRLGRVHFVGCGIHAESR